MRSLYAEFRRTWRPDAAFLRTPEGRCWTYGDLDGITADLSHRIRAAGLTSGDRLVALLERSPWNVFLYLACARVGVIYVPMNPRLTSAELGPAVADADPALLVCDPALEQAVVAMMSPSARVRTLDVQGAGTLLELPRADTVLDPDLDVAQAAAIVFTSGTTGQPKGALMPHQLFVAKARALGATLGYTTDDCLLHTLPLYHSHGLFMTLHCVLNAGASLLLLPRFDAHAVVQCLPQATVFSGVPTMYRRLAAEPGLRQAAAGMRLFVSGSAPLPAEVFKAFEQRSGHRIVECWGMSETMTNTANPLGACRPGSAGKALPGVVLRVVDAAGQAMPPRAVGALEVGFNASFGGYWRRPASAQPTFREGRMVTGDLGYLDEDGYLTIVGRTSEVIITGGYNVYPREVEIALDELPEVARSAVFGIPHRDLGEAVVAVVEPALAGDIDREDLMRKLRSRLVGYRLPKAVFVEPSLPLTELGKVRKAVLAGKYRNHFEIGFE